MLAWIRIRTFAPCQKLCIQSLKGNGLWEIRTCPCYTDVIEYSVEARNAHGTAETNTNPILTTTTDPNPLLLEVI